MTTSKNRSVIMQVSTGIMLVAVFIFLLYMGFEFGFWLKGI